MKDYRGVPCPLTKMLLQKTAKAADTLLNLPMSMNICTADLNGRP